MKKLSSLIFGLVLITCIALTGTVFAASIDCKVEVKTDKTEFQKGDEFTATAYISNIESDRGVIALETVLEYNKTDLTLVSMNGKNGWDTPTKDVSYNEETGKMALTRSGLGKDDEVVFEMKFKVNTDSASTTSITLKDITVANGLDTPKNISTASKDITIKATASKPGTDNPTPSESDDNKDKDKDKNTNTNTNSNSDKGNNTTNTNKNTNTNNTNTNSNSNTNSNTNKANTIGSTDNTLKNGSIPKAGLVDNSLLTKAMFAITCLGLYFYARIRILDKRASKMKE